MNLASFLYGVLTRAYERTWWVGALFCYENGGVVTVSGIFGGVKVYVGKWQ